MNYSYIENIVEGETGKCIKWEFKYTVIKFIVMLTALTENSSSTVLFLCVIRAIFYITAYLYVQSWRRHCVLVSNIYESNRNSITNSFQSNSTNLFLYSVIRAIQIMATCQNNLHFIPICCCKTLNYNKRMFRKIKKKNSCNIARTAHNFA